MSTTTLIDNEASLLKSAALKESTSHRSSLIKDIFFKILSNKIAMISLIVILAYFLVAILCATGLIFKDYSLANEAETYLPPSWNHWFGTDFLGRDVLSRASHAIVTALSLSASAALLSILIGTILGSIAGYFGGLIDDLIVWLYTTLNNIPDILLLASFAFILGPGLSTVIIAFGLTSWTSICRLVRAEFLKHREQEYVQAARSVGASHSRRIFIHILPNIAHVILIQFSIGFVGFIKAEVILTYLGMGVDVGTPSWGVMISDAKLELARGVWWNLAAATFFMFFLILAFNLFTDALRDALDPKNK